MYKGTCRYLHFGSNRQTFSSSESSAIKLASFSFTTFQQSWDESTNLTALHMSRKTIPHPPCRPHRRCSKTDNESSIQTMYRWSKSHPFHFHRRTQQTSRQRMGRHHQRSHREAAHLQHSKVNSSELEENRYHHFRRQ